MNWGKSIALVYIVFALSMIGFVFAARNHPPQMVQKDYYHLDLNYQDHLEKRQRAAALAQAPTAVFNGEKQAIEIQLPEGMTVEQGTIKCYQSADAAADFTVSFDQHTAVTIPKNRLRYGRWHFDLDWVSAGKSYFYETAVFVP